jgi:hypothetical protein
MRSGISEATPQPVRVEVRQEGLRALGVAESAHAPLPFAGRLMTVLGAIVHAGGGLHEHVLDASSGISAFAAG